MKLWDGTQIVKPVVDYGLTQWGTMVEDVQRDTAGLVADVKAALAAAPWGGGAEGKAFSAAYFRDDGPTRMLTQCVTLLKEIADAGDRVRAAVDNTLQTDADIQRDIQAGLIREI
ncbi:hypothetical protein [Nonomuraea sp. NPDC002799]